MLGNVLHQMSQNCATQEFGVIFLSIVVSSHYTKHIHKIWGLESVRAGCAQLSLKYFVRTGPHINQLKNSGLTLTHRSKMKAED